MKRTKIVIASLLAVSFSIVSCSKDFLEKKPSETLANPPAQPKLYGLYSMMIKTGTGGTTNHDDFGQKGYDIYSDLLSSDMAIPVNRYGWYSSISEYKGTDDRSDLATYKPWRYYYRMIFAINEAIEGLGGNDSEPLKQEDKYAMGQAKALRAYNYFNLMNLYTTKYEPSSIENSIPLYVSPETKYKEKAAQSEIYNLMVKDLNDAVKLLDGYTRPNKGVIDKSVAQGILAYVYAAMGNYTEAAKVSLEIIKSQKYPLTSREELVYMDHKGTGVSSGGGFNDLSTRSWMWGYDITIDNKLDLVSWWGQCDVFTFSYAWAGSPKLMDDKLYSQIKDKDLRKQQFGTYGKAQNVPLNKFFYSERKPGGQRNITADYIFMRVDEFHLLAAESLAKSGDETQAKQVYKNFLATRFSEADASEVNYIDALSGDALTADIYLNTRIELWGEGKVYSALKRNRASVTRGTNHPNFNGETFQYDDSKLTLTIPEQEWINNLDLK